MWFPPVTSAFVVPWGSVLDSGVARHPLRRCFQSEPPAVYAARPGDNDGFLNVRTYDLNTANVVSSSRDSACPLMFLVHSMYIAKVCDTSTRLHVRVTSMDQCCLVAHSGDNMCYWIFLTHGPHLAAGMGRHVGP